MWKPLIPKSLIPGTDYHDTSLLGSVCSVCGTAYFPFHPVCHLCKSDRGIAEQDFGRTGILLKHIVATVAPPGFSTPHVQGMVKVAHGAVLLARLAGDKLADGMELEMVPEISGTDQDGTIVVSFHFRAKGVA